jgi:hypothetical protein
MNDNYTAELKNAKLHDGEYGQFLTGRIYGDKASRWSDGSPIVTTRVCSIVGDLYTTRNNTYKVTFADN